MKRITQSDLIEAAEAVAQITGQAHIFIIGMASTAQSVPTMSEMLTDDIDLFTPDAENCFVEEVIASVGEGSSFEGSHGFYVERLGTWVLLTQPRGWMERALLIPHPTLTIRVLHPLDLVYNKLETGRKKDLEGVTLILRSGAVTAEQIYAFVQDAETPEETKLAIVKNLQRILEKNSLQNRSSTADQPPTLSE